MWELVTRRHPFEEFRWMSDLEMSVIDGKRPDIPLDCPAPWKELTELCWHQDPEKRPSFAKIQQVLIDIQPKIAPNLKIKK